MVLTSKEQEALMALIANGLHQMGGTTPSDLLNDNCSWFDAYDLVRLGGFSYPQAAGLMSTLSYKGVVASNEGWYVTEAGINKAQEIQDNGGKQCS